MAFAGVGFVAGDCWRRVFGREGGGLVNGLSLLGYVVMVALVCAVYLKAVRDAGKS